MRRIGVIGGMSWESTALYYAELNRLVAARLGGLHSADVVISSVDFAPVEQLQATGRWDDAGALLAARATDLQAAGAELLVLATNTMHLVADAVQAAVTIPLLHIADPTGRALRSAGHRRVGLLATRFTMEQAFYRDRLAGSFGLEVLIPDAPDRETVHRIIYDELCRGVIHESSREEYRGVIGRLAARGAEAVILGCTEITLLIGPDDVAVPVFDTTALHVGAAIEVALT